MTARCQTERLSANRPTLELTLSAMPILGVRTIPMVHRHRNRLPFDAVELVDHIEGRVAADAHKWHRVAVVKRDADVFYPPRMDSLRFTRYSLLQHLQPNYSLCTICRATTADNFIAIIRLTHDSIDTYATALPRCHP